MCVNSYKPSQLYTVCSILSLNTWKCENKVNRNVHTPVNGGVKIKMKVKRKESTHCAVHGHTS